MNRIRQLLSSDGAIFTLVLICAIAVLCRSAFNASNLEITPDSVEYASAGHHLAMEGRYCITMNGKSFPPRYPPCFSALVTAPAYLLFGGEPGNAMFPVTVLAVLGIGAAFQIGRRVSGAWGGALAALGILALPVYRFYSRQVMTDVPATTLILVLCLLFMRMRTIAVTRQTWLYLFAGLMIAVCSGFRSTFLALLVPFVVFAFMTDSRRRAIANLLCLAFPVLLITAATLYYNKAVFGSPLRNGYHYWCGVPYDYFNLTFSMSYLQPNLALLASGGLPILIIAAILLLVAGWRFGRFGDIESPIIRSLVQFTLLSMAPIAIFCVFYFFFPDDGRFLLPIFALLICILGSTLGLWLRTLPRLALPILLIPLVAVGLFWRYSHPDDQPRGRLAADLIRANTESNAVIVSTFDPVYIEFLVGDGKQRVFVPLSRRVEYASKLITAKKIENPVPPPANARDHRCRGLIAGGAVEAVTKVAGESPEWLAQLIMSGVPVYLYGDCLRKEDLATVNDLESAFTLRVKSGSLYQMQIRQK